jgi:uncharacterized protein YjlB
MAKTLQDLTIEEHRFTDDGHVPNNPSLPVVIYRAARCRGRLQDPVRDQRLGRRLD